MAAGKHGSSEITISYDDAPSHHYGIRVPARMRRTLEAIAERDAASVSATIRRLVAVGLRHERLETVQEEPHA